MAVEILNVVCAHSQLKSKVLVVWGFSNRIFWCHRFCILMLSVATQTGPKLSPQLHYSGSKYEEAGVFHRENRYVKMGFI